MDHLRVGDVRAPSPGQVLQAHRDRAEALGTGTLEMGGLRICRGPDHGSCAGGEGMTIWNRLQYLRPSRRRREEREMREELESLTAIAGRKDLGNLTLAME